jgi:hypothetical protein
MENGNGTVRSGCLGGGATPARNIGRRETGSTIRSTAGAIVGYAENRKKDPGRPTPQLYPFKPVIWFEDWTLPLPTGSDADGVASSIVPRVRFVQLARLPRGTFRIKFVFRNTIARNPHFSTASEPDCANGCAIQYFWQLADS